MKLSLFCIMLAFMCPIIAHAQDATALVKKIKTKLSAVTDYEATGVMKTDVSFMKVPESHVIMYYKKPDKFRIKKQEGIAVTPKGGISVNLNSLLAGDNYTIIDAGKTTVNGMAVSIIKLLPSDEKNDVVVSTLYIDEKALLIRKATVTTKNNGTYEMEMLYGKYAEWGLPDKIALIFNIQEYKLPKGLAFDYDTEDKPITSNITGVRKGKVELTYNSYTINKGLDEAIFR